MKKHLLVLYCFVCFGLQSQQTLLPDELKPFVLENFKGQSVRSILPFAANPKLYEVTMEDKSTFLYDSKKNLKGIVYVGEDHSLEQRLNQQIKEYLNKNYPTNRPESWILEKKKEKITLDDGTKLVFSAKDYTFLFKE